MPPLPENLNINVTATTKLCIDDCQFTYLYDPSILVSKSIQNNRRLFSENFIT